MLVESWFTFILTWYARSPLAPLTHRLRRSLPLILTIHIYRIPLYGYIRLLFLLYLILPQTQGARVLYEERVHPFLQENEGAIDDFIATSHSRLKAAGLSYFRQAVEYIREHILNMPPSERQPTPDPSSFPNAQTYTQSLLARFSVPAPRWAGAANSGADFYNFLSGAMSAATGAGTATGSSGTRDMSASGTLIPPNLSNSKEKMSFISTQRERLNAVMAALDREAHHIQTGGSNSPSGFDGAHDDEPTQRPPSGLSMFSAISKSRSEADFEKIEAESGAEDDNAALRKRHVSGSTNQQGGSWVPWGLGGSSTGAEADPKDS